MVTPVRQKIRREAIIGLSKMCLKRASVDYLGLRLEFPLIYGMGRDYIIPREFWFRKCLEVFLKRKPGAVIDVGANVGVYLVNLRTIDKDRPYYGFEPSPAGMFYLHELIRLNSFSSTYVLPFALSDKKEVRTLFARKRGDSMASIHEFINQDRNFSLKILTHQGDDVLDSLAIAEIAVIKIDVEGAELEVMHGLKATIERHGPYIHCEVWPLPGKDDPIYSEKEQRLTKMLQLLETLGYCVLGMRPDDTWTELRAIEDFADGYSCEYVFAPSETSRALMQELSLKRDRIQR